ncbi:hypothetical protein XJ44_03915 [Thermosipho affectus]|uniref:Glycoside hydrolase family 38 central domain-containing protein n=1 Tax=Thermosipho affectus TaxID=660294 RepID=A0ABX3IHZ7_9BACT|nr:glycosyl hydrolase-related protein [Thermosipho affectus]ONN27464.1 hypothetical protein XJ44_03915 [Thermosipho affectus]
MTQELEVRKHLGIPNDAERVLIFTESSHWDPNWLYTSEEYFERFVQKNLDLALKELEKNPRRIYSLENIFFLKMYLDKNPEKREVVKRFVNEGRLRLMSSAPTSADTILPKVESILRDFLIGQLWLEENKMTQKPKVAYFPDSFGASPFLPSLLNAAGFEKTAITRVDGMYFPGCDLESRKNFPREGSTAEILLKKEKTLDFIWKDKNGGKVLAHWNAFTYGMGDMLSYIGISRVYLARFAIPLKARCYIARKVHQYVRILEPFSKTPYMLCPIGFDFVEPISDLVELLERYNREYYSKTGIWTVVAGLDDYLTLVGFHEDKLPVLEVDPNPYWTGFYVSRPEVKKLTHSLVEKALLFEKMLIYSKNYNGSDWEKLKKVWWIASLSNHHDFITGTSTDEVVEREQLPWLKDAEGELEEVFAKVNEHTPKKEKNFRFFPKFSENNQKIFIRTACYEIEINKRTSLITRLCFKDKENLLNLPSNDSVLYRDSGGLWRMGYEFKGGIWKEFKKPVKVYETKVIEHNNALEIVSVISILGNVFKKRLWIENEDPIIYFRVEGRLKKGYTLSVRFNFKASFHGIYMHAPGGVIHRPCKKIYAPTFWPLNEFAFFKAKSYHLVIFKPFPGAISCKENGRIEISLMRSAQREKAFGIIGLPANPVSLKKHKHEVVDYGVMLVGKKDNVEEKVIKSLKELSFPWEDGYKELKREFDFLIRVFPNKVLTVSVKRASKGNGIIARFYAPFGVNEVLKIIPNFDFKEAYLCNARERDIEKLKVSDGVVYLKMNGAVATVRFVDGF